MDADGFKEALAHLPTGVTIVAYRDERRVIGTTVSAFMSLSAEPPLVLLALGPNATVRPFLKPGEAFGVSILGLAQRRLATIFADSFPVGPDPFVRDGPPVIEGAPVALTCRVTEVRPGAAHAVVIAAVEDATLRGGDPLVRHDRRYAGIRPL